MAQYVDIMTDAGFKAVFQDKQVTIKFLNAALAGERQIKDITYLDKEIKPETVENRTIIFDLLCEDVSGAKFILEMQNCPQHYFFNSKRLSKYIFYSSFSLLTFATKK